MTRKSPSLCASTSLRAETARSSELLLFGSYVAAIIYSGLGGPLGAPGARALRAHLQRAGGAPCLAESESRCRRKGTTDEHKAPCSFLLHLLYRAC